MAGQSEGRGKMDIAEQQETYRLFKTLTKWSVIFTLLALIGLAVFLTNEDPPRATTHTAPEGNSALVLPARAV